MKASLFLFLPTLLLALADPQPSPEAGCEPAYWFVEEIVLDPDSLPQGISVTALDAHGAERTGIKLENETGEMLFVLSLQYQERVEEPLTPDPTYAARLRYAHEVASYLVPPEAARSVTLGVQALLDLDPNLQERNRLDASRPSSEVVIVPAEQSSMLLMVYGEQVLRVPFTITYGINPDYSPESCGELPTVTGTPAGDVTQSPSEQRSDDLQRGLPGLALLVLVVAAWLGANLLDRFTRKS